MRTKSNEVVEPTASVGNTDMAQTITVAVAGNPNAGKSTLINAIAGTRLHVGNWPGVTVEKKEAALEYHGKRVKLVDLPGTYSLSPYTQEEVIARDYLIHEKPDLIVNVVDATNLERNLYLTIQLLELSIPVIMALNVFDEAEHKGFRFNIKAMEEMLGVMVIPTVATKNVGTHSLLDAIVHVAENRQSYQPKELRYDEDVEDAVDALASSVTAAYPYLIFQFPVRWLMLKILEGDCNILEKLNIDSPPLLSVPAVEHLKRSHEEDIESFMADERYGQAAGLVREVLTKPEIRKIDLTEKIDRVMLNRYLGVPIFLAAMWLMFKLTFDVSAPFIDWIDETTAGPLTRWTAALLTWLTFPEWTVSLVTEGIIGGVGFVLVFVPVIFAMMFFITFLEGSGYMARAAFVMDRAMHSIGLHGKSFIPMLLGFGCNVPGIYATRTLENSRDKALTALLIPLMSCGARLPVYVLFTGVFFARHSGTVLWSLYVLGMTMAVVVGMIMKKTIFRGESPMFIMELPPYRLPSMKNLVIHTWEKGKHFLIKAGTYILAVSVFVWFLLNIPWGVDNKKDSFLGKAGQAIAPVFEPLGFGNWEAASSLITGVIAKEIVVGTMGEIYAAPSETIQQEQNPSFSEDLKTITLSFAKAAKDSLVNVFSTFGIASISTEQEEGHDKLQNKVRQAFTPLSAYAFMVFVLLYMPCVVVGVAMRHEFGTWKWFGIAFAYQMALAWGMAFVIYQGGKLLGLGV